MARLNFGARHFRLAVGEHGEGKLRRGDLGLYLTVEENTLDILLARLPWGLSPVMHTWMREWVWVNWFD